MTLLSLSCLSSLMHFGRAYFNQTLRIPRALLHDLDLLGDAEPKRRRRPIRTWCVVFGLRIGMECGDCGPATRIRLRWNFCIFFEIVYYFFSASRPNPRSYARSKVMNTPHGVAMRSHTSHTSYAY